MFLYTHLPPPTPPADPIDHPGDSSFSIVCRSTLAPAGKELRELGTGADATQRKKLQVKRYYYKARLEDLRQPGLPQRWGAQGDPKARPQRRQSRS